MMTKRDSGERERRKYIIMKEEEKVAHFLPCFFLFLLAVLDEERES